MRRITLENGSCVLEQAAAVYCAVDGAGEICGEQYSRPIQKGDYFFLPAAAAGKYEIKGEKLSIVECYS